MYKRTFNQSVKIRDLLRDCPIQVLKALAGQDTAQGAWQSGSKWYVKSFEVFQSPVMKKIRDR